MVAIEANPDLVSFCSSKFSSFVESGLLSIVHGAITDDEKKSSIKFYKNTVNTHWGTVAKGWANRNAALGAASIEIEVPVVDFGNILSQYGCPYYLKIDIEGMDLVCLKKLLVTNCRPAYISLESDKVDFNSVVEEFDVLASLGYRKFFIQQQEGMSRMQVPIGSEEGTYVSYSFPEGSTGPFGADLGPNWLDRDEALKRYKKIFTHYKLSGDNSPFGRLLRNHDHFRYYLQKVLRKPATPGWYDTHAKLDEM